MLKILAQTELSCINSHYFLLKFGRRVGLFSQILFINLMNQSGFDFLTKHLIESGIHSEKYISNFYYGCFVEYDFANDLHFFSFFLLLHFFLKVKVYIDFCH